MEKFKKDQILAYLQNQLSQSSSRLKGCTIDQEGKEFFRRSAALVIDKYIRDFTKKGVEPRWVAIPGLRGVGKTTMLAQIYTVLKCENNHKLYISLDEVRNVLNVSLAEVLEVYEEILGSVFEQLKSEVYLFIDEIHYDPEWSSVLKTIYDRTKKAFIICTGSSALSIQGNPDVSRRIVLQKLYPTSFTEYQLLKNRRLPLKGLAESIRSALFQAENANEVYQNLSALEQKVNQYWINIDRLELERYLNYGTIPFTLQYQNNEALIYQQINQTLNNIVYKDLPLFSKFDSSTISQILQILYTIASQDVTSVNKIASIFKISPITLAEILNVLSKCEVLFRVLPYGTHIGQVKKPSKYLFVSPAYRSVFFNLVGSTQDFNYYKGKLLEDTVGLYLYRIFQDKINTSVTYDSSEKGADFIVKINEKIIPIEVGYGNKDFKQVEKTLTLTKGQYGLSISPAPLMLNEKKTAILVPLKFFLLI